MLISRVGRMEAKGCAKPAVWKQARRQFYWALRAAIARSSALAQLAAAAPDYTVEQRSRLLDSLVQLEESSNNNTIAEVLEAVDLKPTIAQLKGEYLSRQLLEASDSDRKSLLSGLIQIVDGLVDDEKAVLLSALQNSNRSPGMFRTEC